MATPCLNPASFETAALMIGWMNTRAITTAISFQTILRPAACFLMTRTSVTISSTSKMRPKAQPYKPAAAAADSTLSQSLSQISEP